MNSMNVLCDFHHTDLFRSLRFLFEKRLGFRIYRPLGEDWWENGYYHHPEPDYGRGCLTQASFHRGHLRDYDLEGPSHYPHGPDWREWSWITLKEASETIDLVISTHPSNENAFRRFGEERRPKAKKVRYIGNEGEYPSEHSQNLLCSNLKTYHDVKKRHHAVFFHPEINASFYHWTEPPHWDKPVIRTFLNYIYHNAPQSDKTLYQAHRKQLDGRVHFFAHGLGTPPPGVNLTPGVPLWAHIHELYGNSFQMPNLLTSDGEPESHAEISNLMHQTNLAWHVKTADGFGYALHQLYACGRPVICQRKNYEGKTGGLLLKDKKTCVMIDDDLEKDVRKILRFTELERNRRLCENARAVFRKVVDFNREEKSIRQFLERLR